MGYKSSPVRSATNVGKFMGGKIAKSSWKLVQGSWASEWMEWARNAFVEFFCSDGLGVLFGEDHFIY